MESTQQSQAVTITNKAAEKVAEFMKQEGNTGLYLRVYVSGGGCSGLSYGMGFEEKADDDDSVIEQNGVKVLVDTYSQRHLNGARLQVPTDCFKINNPNVTKSCLVDTLQL
jgi:iron-sulfur cluster assembly protein